MRADDEVDLSVGELREDRAARGRACRGGEQGTAHAERFEQRSEDVIMLLGKNFRRRHECRLQAVLCGKVDRRRGDHRLTAADVTLHEAVHRPRADQIAQNVIHGALLRAGEGKGQDGGERRHVHRGAALPGNVLAPRAQQPQPQREEIELLKGQTAASGGKRRVALGKVNVLVRVPDAAQSVLLPQRRAQKLVELPGGLVQPLPDRAVEKILPHAGGERIDGHDAAGDGVPPFRLKDGIDHLEMRRRALCASVEGVALADAEGGFEIGLVEVGQLECGALVHHTQLDKLQPLADAGKLGCGGDHGTHAGALAGGQLRDAADRAPVFVGAGKVGDQAFEIGDPKLGEAFRPRLAHALDKAHVSAQLGHGQRPPFGGILLHYTRSSPV